MLPDANHFFKVVKSADKAANAATYSQPGVPLAPHLRTRSLISFRQLIARNSLPLAQLCDVADLDKLLPASSISARRRRRLAGWAVGR